MRVEWGGRRDRGANMHGVSYSQISWTFLCAPFILSAYSGQLPSSLPLPRIPILDILQNSICLKAVSLYIATLFISARAYGQAR